MHLKLLRLFALGTVMSCSCRPPVQTLPLPEGVPSEVVTIETGALQGRVESEVEVFRGVPYAQAPVGALRWRPPQRAPSWEGVRSAESYSSVCMQADATYDPKWVRQPASEDCLFLNVWSTSRKATKAAPVMVWIHGGGFVMGAGSGPGFDGAALARRGVVVVTLNYRLGRFGFFAHPALTREASGEPLGNYGLMDQIAALEWVKRNIAVFGGDPNNVTIFGQSAGGRSVNLLVTSVATRGLFHKAIVESGGEHGLYSLLADDRPEHPSAESIGVTFAKRAGVKTDDAAALRALDAEQIVDGLGFADGQTDRFAGVFIDGHIVIAEPYLGFRSTSLAAVPYLIGYTDGEFAGLAFIGAISDEGLKQYGSDSRTVRAQYGNDDDFHRSFINESFFEEPARRFARDIASHGVNSYIYRFSYIAENERKTARTGAAHNSEVPYVFDIVDGNVTKPTAADHAQATLMADYWANFARTGDPNGPQLPSWPRVDGQTSLLQEFTNDGPVAREHPNTARLDFMLEHLPDRSLDAP